MNKSEMEFTFHDEDWKRLDAKMRARTSDWSVAAERIHAEMRVRVDSVFAKNRHGGRHRGISWDYFAPQYTRKDGTVVPAWGGVPKVRGGGLVKGRLRPSGQRVRAGDSVGQDTNHLRRAAILARTITRTKLTMGTNVEYAPEFSVLRPFLLFFLPADLTMMRATILRFFEKG